MRPEAHLLTLQRGGQKETETGDQWKWEKRVTRGGNFRPPYPQFQTPDRGTPHHATITT